MHESYYADTFVNAGIYADNVEAMADYFVRADQLRPNATLSINEFNILNSAPEPAAPLAIALMFGIAAMRRRRV